MPRPLPSDGVRKSPLTTRWTLTARAEMEAEAERAGVSLTKLMDVSMQRFLGLSEATRDKLLAG